MADRMFKHQTIGMERDATVGVGTGGSIFEVALDGTPHVSQLTTDLMVTARVEVYFQQMVTA